MGEKHGEGVLRGNAVRYWLVFVVAVILASAAAWRGVALAMGKDRKARGGEVRHGSPYIPDAVNVAGERVPLECEDVREALEWEMTVISNWHSQVLLILKRMPRSFAEIEPVLKENGVPDDMKYLAVVESNLYERSYSPSGAAGVWQFLEATARDYGLEVGEDVDERYNLRLSTRAACRYLKESYARFGSWAMAAAAYNMGNSALGKQVALQGESSFYNLLVGVETGRYVFRLIAFKLILGDPERYGFYLDRKEQFPALRARCVEVDTTVLDLAGFARGYGANYKTLKWQNPWLRSNRLPVRDGKKYVVKIVDSSARGVPR